MSTRAALLLGLAALVLAGCGAAWPLRIGSEVIATSWAQLWGLLGVTLLVIDALRRDRNERRRRNAP